MIGPSEDLQLLNSFYDALDAGRACEHLTASDIPFLLEDVSSPQEGMRTFSSPPIVELELSVRKEDFDRARSCLKMAMHLFPEPEMSFAKPDNEEQEELIQVVACETPEDAESVRIALRDAGISSVMRRMLDEEDADFVLFLVDVKALDVERAMNVVECWGNTL